MTRKCTPLDIYFHMANHYKKLQSVKSVVDTSPPIGYYEKLQGGRKSRPPSRAEKRRESASSDRPYDKNTFNITKHDSLNTEATPPTRSQSLPPRPPTRRKLSDMPIQRQYSSRARSSGPASRKNSAQKSRSARSQRSAKSTTPVFAHFSVSVKPNTTQDAVHIEANERSTLPHPTATNEKSKRDTSFKNSISDHEYLQFSLRITEDIIRNDLYTNNEMRRVFNSHLEANRGRLDMDKMTQQIDNLCKELNIPLNETQDDDPITRSQMKAKRNNLSCICGSISKPLKVELKDCECGSTRCLPFQCVQHCVSNIENNSTTCSTSMNTTPSSRGTVRDKTEEVNLQDDFIEIQVYEKPESITMSTNYMPELLTNQADNDMYGAIPYYDETEISSYMRPSLGFLELPLLPSLSRVTEKTEPTTSCETMDVRLEISDPNVLSGSEFDVSDILPVFQHIEQQEIKDDFDKISLNTRRTISFRSNKMKQIHSNSLQQTGEKQEYLVCTQPEHSDSDEIKCANYMKPVPSSAAGGNVFWLICPCGTPQQPTAGEHACLLNEEEKSNSEKIIASTSIKSVPVSEPRTYDGTQSPCISFTIPQAISETRSEPINHSSKMPVPTPRSRSLEARESFLPFQIKPPPDLASLKESATKSNNINSGDLKNHTECNCDDKQNPESQIVQLQETSNIKIRGLNNREEEFILVPGPIYIPKSSIIPMKTENGQTIIPILAPETVRRDIFTFSKDAMVSTDEQWSCGTGNLKQMQNVTSSTLKNIKEPSLSSNVTDNIKHTKSVTSSILEVIKEPSLASNTTDNIKQIQNVTASAFKVIKEPSLSSNSTNNTKQIQIATSSTFKVIKEPSLSSNSTNNTKQIQNATSSTFKVMKEPSLSSNSTNNTKQIQIATSSTFKVIKEPSLSSNSTNNTKQIQIATSSTFKVIKEPSLSSNPTNNTKQIQNVTSSAFKVIMEPSLSSNTTDNIKQTENVTSSAFKVIGEPSLSSNTMDNAKDIPNVTSSTFKMVREPSHSSNAMKSNKSSASNSSTPTYSASVTYSQIHDSATHAVHVTSPTSNISRVSNMPAQPTPISESMLMTHEVRKSIAKPPKAIIKHKGYDPATQSYSGESTALIHLNDYDLTPQRDSNRSVYSNNTSTIPMIAERQPFSYNDKFTLFSKETLLLGDEYEIKNDFASKKSSISSCYDNGLPYAICRFYPNISTQTQSSDFLLPATAPIKLKNSDEQPQEHSPKEAFHKENVQEQQGQKPSILKKKYAPIEEQEPEKQQELEKQEPEKQQKPLEKQESEKQQKPLEKQESGKQQKPLEKQESEKQQKPLEKQESEKQQKPLEKQESDAHQESEEQQELNKPQEQLVSLEHLYNSSEIFHQRSSSITRRGNNSITDLLNMDSEEEILENEPKDNKKEDDFVQQEESRLAENEKNDEEKENGANQDGGENEADIDEKHEDNDINEEGEELDEDEDPFEVDNNVPTNVPRESMMLTIKQVTTDLEKFRKTEIPVDKFVQERYNIPMENRLLDVAEDLLEQQVESAEEHNSVTTSNISSVTNVSYMGSNSKLPFIQVSSSEPLLETKQKIGSESEQALCCGLKRGKKKSRRDIVDVYESAHKIPNISTIPDDQLFEKEPRRPTIDSGYGTERKSLRFDYSAMGKFSKNLLNRRETVDIKRAPSSTEVSITNVTETESDDDLVPVVRIPVVSYRTPSVPQQLETNSVTSAVQFNKNVMTIDSEQRNSVVDILIPQNSSSSSIKMSETEITRNANTSS